MRLRFVICLVENKRIYFKGRASLEIEETFTEEEIAKQREALIDIGKKVVCRHLKTREVEVFYMGENLDIEDALVFEYRAKGKPIQVIFKRTGPLGYFLAKFFPLFF